MLRFAAALILVVAAIALAGRFGAPESDHGPTVLAAASMQEALEAAADAWANDGHPRPVLSFAASSALARQIEAGAPADIFVSADEDWMDTLAGKNLIDPASRAPMVSNSLVLIAPAGSDIAVTLKQNNALVQALGSGRLAMADPDAVPAGRYGKQALETLGLWKQVAGKIAPADNVRGALALVSRSEAPLGLVYATDAGADTNVRVVAVIPSSSHRPISYPLAVLRSAKHPDASALRDFLLSKEAQEIFASFGFEAPRR